MGFFEIVSQNLFKPLTGAHCREYMEVLSLLWAQCKRKALYGDAKSAVLDLVEDYFYGLREEIRLEEDELEEAEGSKTALTPRELAGVFLRRLKSCGWLEEREGGYEEEPSLVINHRVVPLLRAFCDMVTPQTVTYKGKLFKIYKLLQSLGEAESPYESILREVSGDLDELNASLRQLAASIGQYMDELTRGKTPQEILALFETYEEKVVVGAYHRFKTNDNLFYYKSELYDRLELCRTQYLDDLAEDCAAVEQLSPEEARAAILQLTGKMEEDLQEMSEIMAVIDQRHILYRSRAVQRAQFLLLADGTVKSKISYLLRYCAESITQPEELLDWTEEPVAGLFRFYPQGYLSASSLKPPVLNKRPTPIDRLPPQEEIDPAEFALRQEQLMRYVRNAVTAENVNRFARSVLRDRAAVTAGQLAEDYPEDLVKIIGLHTYSASGERQYEICMEKRTVCRGGLRFQDFTVIKRG